MIRKIDKVLATSVFIFFFLLNLARARPHDHPLVRHPNCNRSNIERHGVYHDVHNSPCRLRNYNTQNSPNGSRNFQHKQHFHNINRRHYIEKKIETQHENRIESIEMLMDILSELSHDDRDYMVNAIDENDYLTPDYSVYKYPIVEDNHRH